MDPGTLRALIRQKLADGRLPQDSISKVWGAPSKGETCDGCDDVIAADQFVMKGMSTDLTKQRPLRFHVGCLYQWNTERKEPGQPHSFYVPPRNADARAISGGSSAPAREVAEELGAGPFCTKCLSTRLRLPRFSIEHVVGELRRAFVIDTIEPCLECGSRKTITLHGLNEGNTGAAKSGTLVISKTRTAPATFLVTFVPYLTPRLAPGSLTVTTVEELRVLLTSIGVVGREQENIVRDVIPDRVGVLRDTVLTGALIERLRL